MSVSEKNNPFDDYIITPKTNNNNSNISLNKVETVTSSSQVSPIQPSESMMNLNWDQTGANDPNTIYDWNKHVKQENVNNSNIQNNYVVHNQELLPSILSVNKSSDTKLDKFNNGNVAKMNSLTATPSLIHDLVHNLNINMDNNLTSDVINNTAYQYVYRHGGLIETSTSTVPLPLQERLARLFGYSPDKTTLPKVLCNFLQNIDCVNPFQIINKMGGG